MADYFDVLEERVIGWILRHKLFVFWISGKLLLVTLVSLILTLVTGSVGMGLCYQMIESAHNGEHNTTLTYSYEVDDTTLKNWETIILPVASFLFTWQQMFIYTLVIIYVGLVLYFIVRKCYRIRTARRSGYGEKPEDR